jgi:hypothetical protein
MEFSKENLSGSGVLEVAIDQGWLLCQEVEAGKAMTDG